MCLYHRRRDRTDRSRLCRGRYRIYLTRLPQAADYDVEAAEKGIVFIDELDKIARKG